MLIIRNQQNEKLMNTTDVKQAAIREKINREYTFSFSVLYDFEKTQYIKPPNVAEINDDWFDIVFLKENHSSDGSKFINAGCEHVSYRLNNEEYDLGYFTGYGSPESILSEILDGTPFNVGTVDIVGDFLFSIQEEMSRRAILVMFAEHVNGELEFNKFTISLVKRRGKDEGQQLRIGKNAKGITREIDALKKTNEGQPWVAYEVNVVELGFSHGYSDLERIELGDTRKLIDDDLNLVTTQRIVSYEFDPIRQINSRVEIANFVEDLSDELYKIQKETIYKDRVYNGIRVGPEYGFEAVRSDFLARTVMNATEGIKIQKGDGTGSNWVDVIFLDTDGNARFTGRIDASEIYGGLIQGARIIADTTIDVGTDLRVGNMIYVGKTNDVNKGVVFSELAKIAFNDDALQITGTQVTLSGGGAYGAVNLFSGNKIDIEAGSEINLRSPVNTTYGIDGIKFSASGTTLNVFKNGSYIGSISLDDGAVG